MKALDHPRPVAAPPTAKWVIGFFLLTFAVTWTCFVSIAAGALRANSPAGQAIALLGTFAPSIVALLLAGVGEGGSGVGALLRSVLRWRVSWRWYLFAAGYMTAVKLSVALVHRVALGAWPRFGTEPLYLIPVAILLSTPVQAGEEIGWRGYALPRLASRMGLGPASVLLGAIWALWHLPLFYIPQSDTYHQSFPAYALQVTAISVAIAWLYGHTGKSLLLPMLLHAAINNSKDIVPSASAAGTTTFGLNASPVAWMTVALLWVFAALFLTRMPKLDS